MLSQPKETCEILNGGTGVFGNLRYGFYGDRQGNYAEIVG